MFIQDTVTGQLMIMGPFVFGERYARLALWFPFPLEWRGAVLVNTTYTLVTTVGDGIGVRFEMYPGTLEQLEIMSFTGSEVGADNCPGSFVDDYLAFGSVPFLLAGVGAPLSFFGRSTGDSEASTRTTSNCMSLFSKAFLPGRENCLSLMRVSSTQRLIYQAVLSLTP